MGMKKKKKTDEQIYDEFLHKWCFWYWMIATFTGGVVGGLTALLLFKFATYWGWF